MQENSPTIWQKLATAAAAVAGATVLRAALAYVGVHNPFITFYPAVVLASLYGGAPAGLFATALSAAASMLWLHQATREPVSPNADARRVLVFLLVDVLIVWLGHRAGRSRALATRALAEHERAENRIAGMLDHLAEGFVVLDRDWRFQYVNSICERMFGMSRQDMLGHTLWECFPTAVGTVSEQNFRQAMERRTSVQFEVLSQRMNRWISMGAFPLDDGLSIHVEDIDDRKRAEQALRESEQRYRRLVETAQEGIWMVDAEANTSYVNRAMAEMLGHTPVEMLGRSIFDFMDEAAAAEARGNVERRKQGIAERHDFRFRRKDGTDFYAHLSTNPIMSDGGEYLGALAMVSDVTARRRAETERADLLLREQKARAEAEAANRRKDQFLAVLSHELRTPLTPVLARLALMKREANLSNSLKNGLEMIRRNVELEARLIEDLLDMTRLARGQLKLHPERIDAHEKMLAALEIYDGEITARKQSVTVRLDARDHFVFADGVRLQQVFWNLIGNAVKYTPEGGHLTIQSANASEDGTTSRLRVQVVDTGIGIAADVMPRLFDPFEQGEQTLTRRYGGLGLGLSISRTLMQMQGGTLTAESGGKGLGATFTVEVPTVPSPTAPSTPEMKPATAPPALSPRAAVERVLLVDDNEDTLNVMARLLRLNGHHVITAASVRTALAAASEPFDLLITDIGLPDGTGWELMRVLRQRGPVRGIALSGFSMDDDIRRSREVGFIEHLSKPIMPEDLEEAIKRAATAQ